MTVANIVVLAMIFVTAFLLVMLEQHSRKRDADKARDNNLDERN